MTAAADPTPETSSPATTEPPTETATQRIVVQAPASAGDGIWLLTADGSLDAQLAPEAGSAKHPDRSPDGTQVIFVNDSDGTLWTVGVDGSDPQELLACDTGCLALDFPAYSPDGRRIAYTRYEPPTSDGPPAASTIRVLDLDTMASVEAVRTAQPSLVDVARWSANGEELVVGMDVFDAEFNEVGSTIGVVSASGGDIRELVDRSSFAYAPDWNSRTDEIVYSNETIQYRAEPQAGDDTWNLWGVAPGGSGLRQLTDVRLRSAIDPCAERPIEAPEREATSTTSPAPVTGIRTTRCTPGP